MFDFKISTHKHFNEACRRFARTHNMVELAQKVGMQKQTLHNKFGLPLPR
ncbi:phage regulatory CII family protein [Lonsdalea iberica]